MCVPVGRMIVVGATARHDLVKSMVLYTTPAVIGPLLGPPLTGLILKVADWPWIFYINVPICLLGIAAVIAFVPRVRQPSPGTFDYLGFLYVGVGILASTAVLETLGFALVDWRLQAAAAIVGVVALGLFLRHVRRRPHPILDLVLMRLPSFRASLVGGTFVRIAFGAQPFLLPLLLQVALGWSALKAGSIMVAGAVGSLMVRPLAPAIIRKLGFRSTLVAGTTAYALTLLVPPFFSRSTPEPLVFGVLLLNGMFGTTMFTTLNTVAYAETDTAEVNRASTLYAVAQQLSLSMGVTAGALLLQTARFGGSDAITPERFVLPFYALAAIGLAGLPFFLGLKPGHRRRHARPAHARRELRLRMVRNCVTTVAQPARESHAHPCRLRLRLRRRPPRPHARRLRPARPRRTANQAEASDKVLNLYTARHYDSDQRIYAAFEKKTGIRVRALEMRPPELIERLKAEGASSPADVVIIADAGSLWRAEQAGRLPGAQGRPSSTRASPPTCAIPKAAGGPSRAAPG